MRRVVGFGYMPPALRQMPRIAFFRATDYQSDPLVTRYMLWPMRGNAYAVDGIASPRFHGIAAGRRSDGTEIRGPWRTAGLNPRQLKSGAAPDTSSWR